MLVNYCWWWSAKTITEFPSAFMCMFSVRHQNDEGTIDDTYDSAICLLDNLLELSRNGYGIDSPLIVAVVLHI